MLEEIREKIRKGVWEKGLAFCLIVAFVYGALWAALEPMNLEFTPANKPLYRIGFLCCTLIISILIYWILVIEQDEKGPHILYRLNKKYQDWNLKSKKGYFAELERNFNQMPFIYQGLSTAESLTIKNDHVAASYAYFPLVKDSGMMNVYSNKKMTALRTY